MAPTIGVNLRVTGHCNQGGRKHMEDMFSVAYQQTEDERDLEYAYFGIFDGHGGREAASFAKEHLMDSIVSQKKFWSDDDEDILKAIRDGFVSTHYAMWRELEKWPKTMSGLPSTSGTTASIAFIRKGKIYIGHVGDSSVVIGYQNKDETEWRAKSLTRDHKPESEDETDRIKQCGGKVVYKSGVPRVVWNRPRIGHKGPVRRSTHIDEIPFLAVARSLGDLWSYNSALNQFVVSPEPDVEVIPIDIARHRCLILGTDGLWNMLSAQAAVDVVHSTECHNVVYAVSSSHVNIRKIVKLMDEAETLWNSIIIGRNLNWINPSKRLVDTALEKWISSKLIADNTSVVTLMLDPPGPPRAQVLRKQQVNQSQTEEQLQPGNVPINSSLDHFCNTSIDDSLISSPQSVSTEEENSNGSAYSGAASTGGVVIFTRYPSPQISSEVVKKNDRNLPSSQSHQHSEGFGMEGGGRVREVGNILHDPHCSQKQEFIPNKKLQNSNNEKLKVSLVEPGGSSPVPDASNRYSPEIQSNEVSSSLSEANSNNAQSQAVSKKGDESDGLCSSNNSNTSAHNIEVAAKHKNSWLLRKRTRSEDRYPSLINESASDVLCDCAPWVATASKPQVINGARRRLLSTGDLGKGNTWGNNFASLSNSQRCCRQHICLGVGKIDRQRTIIAPRRGRSRALEACTVSSESVHDVEGVILNEPIMGPSTSNDPLLSKNNSLGDTRVSALMKSCYVVLQRAPIPSNLLNISRHSRKKRKSLSIRQNPVPKALSHPRLQCGGSGGLRRSWAGSSCPQQGSMITRSRKKDDA